MMETTISDHHKILYILDIKNLDFIYHMCAYLVHITVVKYDSHPSNKFNYFNIFYVVVIILRDYLQSLLIKYNQNDMV